MPGVTDTEIVVGTHQPLTGPAAAGYSKIAPATKAYFDYVNANGGVNGRKITYKFMDDGYNPANTQTVVRQLVLQDKVFAILNGLGTPTHTGVLDFLKTNKVPDLFVASGSRAGTSRTSTRARSASSPTTRSRARSSATYVKKTWPGKKVCFFGQDDDFGADSLAGVEKVLGADAVAAKQTYVTTNTNVAPQIGALKAAGCQVVVARHRARLHRAGHRHRRQLGFKPQWVVSSVGADYATLAEPASARPGAAARGPRHRRLPAGCARRRQPVDRSSSRRSTTSTTRTRRSTATSSTACRSATCSCRRCRPPART